MTAASRRWAGDPHDGTRRSNRHSGRGTRLAHAGTLRHAVHLFDRGELLMYRANGITTVRNLHGIPRHLAWRDSISRRRLLGPRILTSGPIVDGDPPTRRTNTVIRTAVEAVRVVAEPKAAGYDYLKIYDNVPRDLYAVLAREAATGNADGGSSAHSGRSRRTVCGERAAGHRAR